MRVILCAPTIERLERAVGPIEVVESEQAVIPDPARWEFRQGTMQVGDQIGTPLDLSQVDEDQCSGSEP